VADVRLIAGPPAHAYCCPTHVVADHSLSHLGRACAVDAATAPTGAPDTPGVFAVAPRLYAGAFALGVAPRLISPEPALPSPTIQIVGLTLLVSGAALAVWSNRVLRQAGTSADPSQPTAALVVTGPFAFSRNPLYLARTLLYVGLALAMNMLWTFVTLGPLLVVMHYGVIRREERYLEATFGKTYRQYRLAVRRWV
jgi:protein-S-isoprenylcysteine O-methyltransferase Ste14